MIRWIFRIIVIGTTIPLPKNEAVILKCEELEIWYGKCLAV